MKRKDVSVMKGGTLRRVIVNHKDDKITFEMESGAVYLMHHEQDCCENVTIEDIAGDTDDLIGSPLVMAEEISSDPPDDHVPDPESETWTFYKFATAKGYVTIRWHGTSNGYYSESVEFDQLNSGEAE